MATYFWINLKNFNDKYKKNSNELNTRTKPKITLFKTRSETIQKKTHTIYFIESKIRVFKPCVVYIEKRREPLRWKSDARAKAKKNQGTKGCSNAERCDMIAAKSSLYYARLKIFRAQWKISRYNAIIIFCSGFLKRALTTPFMAGTLAFEE